MLHSGDQMWCLLLLLLLQPHTTLYTTQTSIFMLFESTEVLFEGDFSLWVFFSINSKIISKMLKCLKDQCPSAGHFLCLWKLMLLHLKSMSQINLNLIQDGGARKGEVGVKKVSLPVFPPMTSKNVGVSPKNFLTFSFNLLATLVENFKLYLVPVSIY